jgi:hypothetical protein
MEKLVNTTNEVIVCHDVVLRPGEQHPIQDEQMLQWRPVLEQIARGKLQIRKSRLRKRKIVRRSQ